ncbi:LOW QUALITY PROTEIN: uncharacterized protein V1477_013092 [Vespula maculifrons]|uniref:Uncharacterized protein n=1 Tax=Vespula maculifrons TaxID=7453 RepID=A0ABD2BUY1_VESMC
MQRCFDLRMRLFENRLLSYRLVFNNKVYVGKNLLITCNGETYLVVSFCMSTSAHRSSRSTHSLEVIEKSQCKYIIISFIFSICYTIYFVLELNCGVGILGFVKRQQSRAFDRLWFNINSSVLLRIPTSTHRSSRSTYSLEVIEKSQCKYIIISLILSICHTIYLNEMEEWGYSPTCDDNISAQLLVQSCYEFQRVHIGVLVNEMEEWGYSPTRDDNISAQLLVQSCYEFRRVHIAALVNEMEEWGYSPTRDDNISAQLLVQSCYEFRRVHIAALVNEMEEWGYSPTRDDNISAQLLVQSCYEFQRVHIGVLVVRIFWKMKLWSGDTGLRETTTESNVRPILIVNGSVLLRISKSTHCSSRSTHVLEVIKKSQRKYIIISLILSIFYTIYLNEMEEWGYSPTRDDNISAQLLVQSCTEFQRIHIGVLVNEMEEWGYSPTRDDNISAQLLVQSCTKFQRIHIGVLVNEMEEWGYSPTRDDNIRAQLLVQSCYEFRRVHIAALVVRILRKIKLWSGDTGLRETTTKSNVRPILIVNGSVLLRISTSTHWNSRSTHVLEVIKKSQCKIKLWSGDTGLSEMTTKSSVRPIMVPYK